MIPVGGKRSRRARVSGGSIDGATVGATTPASGAFTTLSATGLTDLSAAGAGQIKFPATQNASSNVNTLDDYEEGTWTPSFVNLAVVAGGGSVAYSGQYTKIGNLVFWSVLVQPSGGATTESTFGSTFITNFPFTIAGLETTNAAINAGTGANYGNGQNAAGGDNIFPPTWPAVSNGVIISGFCFT